MIKRLKFKQSMFEGALDGGDDTIFLSDDRFKGFMSEIAEVTASSPQPRREENLQFDEVDESPEVTQQEGSEDANVSTFLASLRDILQSPEKTKKLADAITKILNES